MPNYAMEEDEVPGRDWTEEEYSYEETNTASVTNKGYGEDYVDTKHLNSFQKSSIWHKYFDQPPKSPIWHKYFDQPPTSTTPPPPLFIIIILLILLNVQILFYSS